MVAANKARGGPVPSQVRLIEKAEALNLLKRHAKTAKPVIVDWLTSNLY